MRLPGGWVEATIADIATINPKHDSTTDQTQFVSFVPMPAVDEHFGTIIGSIDRLLGDVWQGFTHFADGDVIFAKITPCMENGKAAVARGLTNGLACGSTEFYVFRPADGIDPDYLWRFFRQRFFREDAERQMTGAVGQRRVPRQYLEGYQFLLPPTAEQRRIVAKLDALTAHLARARAELDRVPILARALRSRSLFACFNRSDDTVIELGTRLRAIEAGKNLRCEEHLRAKMRRASSRLAQSLGGALTALSRRPFPSTTPHRKRRGFGMAIS